MTYRQAIQFLYDLQLFGAKFGLENTRRLAELAGNPQEHLRFIHVAGTNGKGSVCAMLESIYRAAGHHTGLHTSPHLIHFGERIRVDNRQADETTIIKLVGRLQQLLAEGTKRGFWPGIGSSEAKTEGHPTFFEVVTVMALIHFAEQACDVVLWETGMGGRLDATNIVTPIASVLTNISVEHSAYLGDTIEKIAAEKSGIIKPGIPVITAVDHPSALKVIREVARSRNAPLILAQETAFPGPVPSRFEASFQRLNARLAAAVVDALQSVLPVNVEQVEKGFGRFSFPGRLQRMQRGAQTILLDGAHNPASMRALRESLDDQKRATIFGCFADKDLPSVVGELIPLVSELHLVPIHSPRSADPGTIRTLANRLSPETPVTVHESLNGALAHLRGETDLLITGSLYLVGDALGLLGDNGRSSNEGPLNDWRASTR